MYVRWKRRNLKRVGGSTDYALDAVLVESMRIGGKPRQRHVAHLASIREDDLAPEAKPQWRAQFWRTVDKRLTGMDLGDGDRARIVATLEDRVPRLTAEQYEAELDRVAREARMMRAIMGGM